MCRVYFTGPRSTRHVSNTSVHLEKFDAIYCVNKKDPWYIDSGCSKHMSRDKEKFVSLTKHKSGNVTFENDAPGKIRGKGMVSLSNGKGKA